MNREARGVFATKQMIPRSPWIETILPMVMFLIPLLLTELLWDWEAKILGLGLPGYLIPVSFTIDRNDLGLRTCLLLLWD